MRLMAMHDSDWAALCQSESRNLISSPRKLILRAVSNTGWFCCEKKQKKISRNFLSFQDNEFENLSGIFGIDWAIDRKEQLIEDYSVCNK